MLTAIKQALGITSSVFDAELRRHMEAAIADLCLVDIEPEAAVVSDALIRQAVTAYCGWQHNLNHGNLDLSERYEKAYEKQKATFITSSSYTEW